VSVPSKDKLGGLWQEGHSLGIKMGDEGGALLISLDGVAPSRIVDVSASNISHCTTKSRRFLLASAHPGSPGKGALKRLYDGMRHGLNFKHAAMTPLLIRWSTPQRFSFCGPAKPGFTLEKTVAK